MTKRKNPEDMLKNGRKTIYTEELADLICYRIATSDRGLPRLCREFDDMPAEATINRWRYENPSFREKYAQAKMAQADLLAEQCLEISDDTSQDAIINKDGFETINSEFVARSRLRIDTRKWLASKLLPKQYGEQRRIETLESQNDVLHAELIK